jgi:hypothetical protein
LGVGGSGIGGAQGGGRWGAGTQVCDHCICQMERFAFKPPSNPGKLSSQKWFTVDNVDSPRGKPLLYCPQRVCVPQTAFLDVAQPDP